MTYAGPYERVHFARMRRWREIDRAWAPSSLKHGSGVVDGLLDSGGVVCYAVTYRPAVGHYVKFHCTLAFQVHPAADALTKTGSSFTIGLFVAVARGAVRVVPPLIVSDDVNGVIVQGLVVLVMRR